MSAPDPYAVPSGLPCDLPPFDRIGEGDHLPALRQGMAVQRAEVEAIASADADPTFANTVEARERSGQLLRRAGNVFFNLVGADSTPSLREAEAEVSAELAAHADAIALDPRLFARLDALHARRHDLGLDGEQVRVLERHHTDLLRAGAGASEPTTARLRGINQELSQLTAAFGTHLLAETNSLAVHVTDASELAGLSESSRSAAALAAAERELPGWVLPLSLPTDQPVLADLDHRGLRERIHVASTSRGRRGGEHDTRELLVRITALRAERAGLLGAAHHAEHVASDATAGSVAAVMEVLTALAPPAVAAAEAEAEELLAELEAAGESGPLRPWDWAWAAARVRAKRFDLDAGALRPYFALDAVLTGGVFAAASALYGLSFAERLDLPLYHPDVRCFEVADSAGALRGLYLLDPYARASKRGGAWMSNYVDQSHLLASSPVVVNVLNIPDPSPGEPALLTPAEVETLFHEFGHALHGLLSDVRYPRLSGTAVPRDVVEFPSQVNEMWAWEPEVLAGYARHHVTGEPLDRALVDRLLAARTSGQGFATTEIVAAMLLDQAWHQLAPGEAVEAGDVEAFEAAALERYGVAVELVPPRYGSTYFHHVFAGGYSAAYYSYLWSEVLDADAVEWFGEHGGLRRENGEVFARELLSRGGTVDPMTAYRAFRGRDPLIEPLRRRRGLVV